MGHAASCLRCRRTGNLLARDEDRQPRYGLSDYVNSDRRNRSARNLFRIDAPVDTLTRGPGEGAIRIFLPKDRAPWSAT